LSKLEIVLLGEVILDQYTEISALAKTSKDPILAFQKGQTEIFAGGALAIANNCASWVKNVNVISFIGNEDVHTIKLTNLLNPKINLDLVRLTDRPTILKHRFVDTSSQVRIFEYYDFVDQPIQDDQVDQLLEHLDNISTDSLLMVADYGHGLISKKVIDSLHKIKNYLAINTQANAGNRGYNTLSKYSRADFFTLNSSEVQLKLRDKNVVFEDVVPKMMAKLSSNSAIITLGANGLIVFDESSYCKSPALGSKVVDKVGAGDSVFAMGALLSFVKAPPLIIGLVCNIVAAHEVTQLGHRNSLEIGDIKKQIKSLLG
jgi:bifunctional ADP-heptose synthase (sugar kinase/adenylyltransferase)